MKSNLETLSGQNELSRSSLVPSINNAGGEDEGEEEEEEEEEEGNT